MKYEITKNDLDNYTLKYKDKEFNYKTDIELLKKLQEAPKLARQEMIMDLATKGMSLKQLTIEEKKNGKTYFDNTNRTELENTYIQNKTLEILNDSCKEKFGLNLLELTLDVDFDTQEEQEKFINDLTASLMGKTPSGG